VQDFLSNIPDYLNNAPALAYLTVLLAGIVTSFTPCVYPIIPLTLGYIGAQAAGSKLRGLSLSLLYTVGMAITYAILGAIAALTGSLFGTIGASPWTYLIVGMIVLLMGQSMLDVFTIETPRFLSKLQTANVGGGWAKPILAGMVFGLIVGPCTAPVLAVVLTYVGTKQNIIYGMSLLFTFGLGLGAIIILTGTFAGLLANLPRSGEWTVKIKRGFGWVMVLASVFLFYRAGQLSYGQSSTPVAAIEQPVPVPAARTTNCPAPAFPVGDQFSEGPQVGRLAPEISLPTADGQTRKLSDLRGQVVVIAFWASWCAPCLKEIPVLKDLQEKYASSCLTVFAVNADDPAPKVSALVRQHGINYPVVLAEGDPKLGERYGVVGVPLTILVDRWGVITWRGGELPDDFGEKVSALVAQDASRPRPSDAVKPLGAQGEDAGA